MFNAIKFIPSRRSQPAVLRVLLFTAVTILLSAPAVAQCANWDASGDWKLVQRGQPYPFDIKLEQKGKVITGTVKTLFVDEGIWRLDGKVDGTIEGNSFNIMIYWANDATGVYNGKVMPSGRLDGEAWEKRSPNVRHIWHSEGVLKCRSNLFSQIQGNSPFSQSKSQSTPPTPKVIKSSGKAKPTTPKPPFIIAGQPVIPPYMAYGTVYIGWEGGPDHPNVEVFLSIDNGPEIPAFSMEHAPQSPVWKQPKMASIPLKLQRYHHYKFVLKAAGKALSTAAFVVP